jgi:hypothetical protein
MYFNRRYVRKTNRGARCLKQLLDATTNGYLSQARLDPGSNSRVHPEWDSAQVGSQHYCDVRNLRAARLRGFRNPVYCLAFALVQHQERLGDSQTRVRGGQRSELHHDGRI